MATEEKKIETHIFIPDIHYPFHDKKSLESVFYFVEAIQPDVITQLGDLVDFYHLSSYSKDPTRLSLLQIEVEMAREFWKRMNEICPDSKKFMKEGNHEHRLYTFLCKNPALAVLEDLSLQKLLRLEENNVKFSSYQGDLLFFNENLLVTHGDWTNKNAAYTHIDRHGVNCVFGHTHRASTASKKNYGCDLVGVECGFLGDLDSDGFTFMGPKTGDWVQAICVGHYDSMTKKWNLELVRIKDHNIYYGNKIFTPEGVYNV